MSVTPLSPLSRTSPTFRDDLDAFFQSQLPACINELNTEIDRINSIGYGSYTATSSTSLAFGTGSKVLAIEPGKSFAIGQLVIVASTAAPSSYMVGQVTAHDASAGSLTVNVTSSSGSGTVAAWMVAVTAVSEAISPDSYVVLTSGTSWTNSGGHKKARLRMVGGCGSGRKGASSSDLGCGGYAGAGLEAIFTLTVGASYTYAIGAGGAAQATAGTNGSAGSATTFTANGVTYTANGGPGGASGYPAVATASGTGAVTFDGAAAANPQIGAAYGRSPGGATILATKGGYGSTSSENSGAGDNGKIILELYK